MTIGPGDEAARDAADSVTFAFGDAAAGRYGLARLGLSTSDDGAREASALAVLFAGREPVAVLARGGLPVPDDADWASLALPGLSTTVEEPLARWRVAFTGDGGHGFDLELAAAADPAELAAGDPVAALGGMAGYEQPCRVTGTVRAGGRESRVNGLGQRGHAWGTPDWGRLELTRAVAAWTADGPSAALSAIRPAGARHHAEEAMWGALWEPTGLLALDHCRLSTTYDAEGRTRRAGFELWPAGAEENGDAWARRGAGEVLCGSSLDLGALRLDVAFFRWHLEGREGVGRYDVLRRA